MELVLNVTVALLGLLLVLAAIYIAVTKEKFGMTGVSLLTFGFLFGCIPFVDNVAMKISAGQGIQLEYESRLARVENISQLTAEASHSLARCVDELYQDKELWALVKGNPNLKKLLSESMEKSNKANQLLSELKKTSVAATDDV